MPCNYNCNNNSHQFHIKINNPTISMAVDAHHLHPFFSPHQLASNREVIGNIENQQIIYNSNNMNMHMGYLAQPQPPMVFQAGTTNASNSFQLPLATVVASDSSVTFNNHLSTTGINTVCRKRPHEDEVSSHLQQQLLDVDRLVLQHTEKVRIEMMQRGKGFLKQVIIGMEQNAAKRLKAKDEEIERISKLNWALEERIKSLCVESQIWRDLAQSNEATANMLRSNLEQALVAAQIRASDDQNCDANYVSEDAESCCSGEAKDENEEKEVEWGRACRCCESREVSVLLLPCRHLCLCSGCGPVDVCPVCSCTNTGTLHVNLS